jgi:TonB family protein
MMSAYANSLQKPESFDRYVRKFRSICTMHGVEIGSRTKLPDFMRKLIEDRHLAMDFWAFIGKVSDREGGELSDDQMLGVVVEGIAEGEISEEDNGQMRTVDDLRAMLSGVDVQSQAPVVMAPFPKSATSAPRDEVQQDAQRMRVEDDPTHRAVDQLWTRAEESATKLLDSQERLTQGRLAQERLAQVRLAQERLTQERLDQERLTQERLDQERLDRERLDRDKFDAKVNRPTVLPTTPPPQLDEALLRLELTKLVQQYFENIDKRISKLEPDAEGAASIGTTATAVTRRSLEEPVSGEESEELRLRSTGKSRLVLEPAPAPVEESLGESLQASRDDDDIPMTIPLAHYSSTPVYGKAPLLLVLVLIGAAFAVYRDPTLFKKGFAVVVRQFHDHSPVSFAKRSTSSVSPAEDRSAKTEPSQPSAGERALEGTSTPPPANASEQTAPVRSQPAENVSGSSNSGRSTTDRAAAQTEQALESGISNIETAGAVKVNPSVMDENLIVQRVPAYPEGAKISGVEGDVVMQALISKEGTVMRVHVTEGDSRLRSAAEEAVYKWRYRPYVLNGRPVEVATTVRVNFNLDRR